MVNSTRINGHLLNKIDMAIMLPNELVGIVGKELPKHITLIVRAVAKAGFAPVDFGEGDDDHVLLWFEKDDRAKQRCEDWIEIFARGNTP